MPSKTYEKIILVIILLLTVFTPVFASPKVGVVLGGGAARGFSHIGLIQALEENGVPIDLLVGTSMGSIISSLYAAGYSVENMRQVVDTLNTAELIDLTIPPKGGLVSSSRLQHYLDILLHHKQFDQLKTPFYSVITNIRTGEEVALNTGLVSIGVQASMSIPALFPPVLLDGQYYVDGGMKNAVPANVAKDQGADVIIAVDVKKDLKSIDHDNVLTNFQLSMWFMIDGYVQTNTSMADVIIVPEVKYDSYMDYQKVEFFIEQGYLAGLDYMDQIKEAILAHDPDFQFIPYTQDGFSYSEIDFIITQATIQASNLPRPLSVVPEITLDPLEEFPQLGLKVVHGPLSWFGLGYRFGINKPSIHEIFLKWSKDKIGHFEAFIRHSPDLSNPAWGAQIILPITEKVQLSSVFLSQGPTKWQVSNTYKELLKLDHFTLDGKAKLTKRRTHAKELLATINPVGKLYPLAEPHPALEIALIHPYIYGGLELSTPINHWDAHLAYQFGIGSELKIFGLYPIEMNIGLRTEKDTKTSWRFQIKGGSF